jgi:hypothetical protein
MMRLVWLVALGLACGATARVHADEPASTAALQSARIHFQSGREYYRDGHAAQAFAEFVEAYRLAPRPELLYNRALCLEALKLEAEALTCYRAYLSSSNGSGRDDQLEAEARVADLGRRLGRGAHGAACPTELDASLLRSTAARPIYKRWWPWTILGVGVAVGLGLGVGLGVGLNRESAYSFPVVK